MDEQIERVLQTLKSGDKNFYRDTVVVFMSDHGELLGAHGGLF